MRADPEDPRHHLRIKSGVWQMRFTVFQGEHFKGKRVVISLGTECEEEASKMRDVILKALWKSGVLAADPSMSRHLQNESEAAA